MTLNLNDVETFKVACPTDPVAAEEIVTILDALDRKIDLHCKKRITYSGRSFSMKKELIQKLHKSFEDCAHEKDGVEFWRARELQSLLGYAEWRNFTAVVEKAKLACENAGQVESDHFVDVNKMIDLAKGAQREVDDLALTRYA